jgi:hypothetical protein
VEGGVPQNIQCFRVFNAHRATYAERIALLGLKHIDQDWLATLTGHQGLQDWAQRNLARPEL